MGAGNTFGGNKDPLNVKGGHGCINMMSATNVVTHKKGYGPSQPKLGKDLVPLEKPLHIDKPKDIPCIPKGVLKCLGHNTNA